ncbi:phosphatase PAP2 family protein [Frigoriflavimonas asaccharolytica]|uniref:Tryptophan-rich sensory protein n=1 Tax=Frigoriflavimonas asaccharolytica TaxID=2735899 RepID=A0A8J8G690_9FLAO|nr:phosphatase PAP2 family protein [Frigoriflavimonas asaccharolytica]NRS91490.1 tryptophan-rich sensory protein [Frigoriflavimonas asaccharolytica]
MKKGNYQNLDVSNRVKRKSLYIFINSSIFIYLLFDFFVKESFDVMMFFLLVLLLIMQVSNFFIKSSMHTALNFFVAALFISQNFWLGITWILISILVGISRIIVKRHTPKEVLMGFLLSTVVSFAYLYTFIQMQIG